MRKKAMAWVLTCVMICAAMFAAEPVHVHVHAAEVPTPQNFQISIEPTDVLDIYNIVYTWDADGTVDGTKTTEIIGGARGGGTDALLNGVNTRSYEYDNITGERMLDYMVGRDIRLSFFKTVNGERVYGAEVRPTLIFDTDGSAYDADGNHNSSVPSRSTSDPLDRIEQLAEEAQAISIRSGEALDAVKQRFTLTDAELVALIKKYSIPTPADFKISVTRTPYPDGDSLGVVFTWAETTGADGTRLTLNSSVAGSGRIDSFERTVGNKRTTSIINVAKSKRTIDVLKETGYALSFYAGGDGDRFYGTEVRPVQIIDESGVVYDADGNKTGTTTPPEPIFSTVIAPAPTPVPRFRTANIPAPTPVPRFRMANIPAPTPVPRFRTANIPAPTPVPQFRTANIPSASSGVSCDACNGEGFFVCRGCDGEGGYQDFNLTFMYEFWHLCAQCDGDGKIECQECYGDGVISQTDTASRQDCPYCTDGSCAACFGTGISDHWDSSVLYCQSCGGSKRCTHCGGDGVI